MAVRTHTYQTFMYIFFQQILMVVSHLQSCTNVPPVRSPYILLHHGKFYLLLGNLLWKPPVDPMSTVHLYKYTLHACAHTHVHPHAHTYICLNGVPL